MFRKLCVLPSPGTIVLKSPTLPVSALSMNCLRKSFCVPLNSTAVWTHQGYLYVLLFPRTSRGFIFDIPACWKFSSHQALHENLTEKKSSNESGPTLRLAEGTDNRSPIINQPCCRQRRGDATGLILEMCECTQTTHARPTHTLTGQSTRTTCFILYTINHHYTVKKKKSYFVGFNIMFGYMLIRTW